MVCIHSFVGEGPVTSKSTVSLKSKEKSIDKGIRPAQAEGVECVDNHCLYQNAVQMSSWSKDRWQRSSLKLDRWQTLSLKTTEVRILNQKSKECVNPMILYTNFSMCVHFSVTGISSFHQIPKGAYEQHPHPTWARPPKAKTCWMNSHPGVVMTEQWYGIYWGHFLSQTSAYAGVLISGM